MRFAEAIWLSDEGAIALIEREAYGAGRMIILT